MGAWGFGIRDDDFVLDVVGTFEDCLKNGGSLADATKAVTSRYAAAGDDDVDPLFWIALADLQWTYGELDPDVLTRVRSDFAAGRSLEPWDADERGRARRRGVLERFVAKISLPNRRPKKPPRTIVRAPKFQPGDCLSIRLPDGQYGAALVLAANHSAVEYGSNLIGMLDYLSPEKPTTEVFRTRQWPVLTHSSFTGQPNTAWYYPIGFRAVKDRIEIVGRVEILDSDPKDSSTYLRWSSVGDQVIRQRAWNAPQGAP